MTNKDTEEMTRAREDMELVKKIMKNEEFMASLITTLINRTDRGEYKYLDTWRKLDERGIL